MSERNLRTSQVDELRDVAVELINRSSKHDEAVELQLTAFNQRWQDIDTRIKVFTQHCLHCHDDDDSVDLMFARSYI